MKKVLIVETNIQNYQGTDEPTGLWLGESTEFIEEIQKAGIKVDYVSPKGGFVPIDPRSMKYVNKSIMSLYHDKEFILNGLANTKKQKISFRQNTWLFIILVVMVLCGIFQTIKNYKKLH